MRIGNDVYLLSTLAREMGDDWEDVIEELAAIVDLDWGEAIAVIEEDKLFEFAYDNMTANQDFSMFQSNIEYFDDNLEEIISSAIRCGELKHLKVAITNLAIYCNQYHLYDSLKVIDSWELPGDEFIRIYQIMNTYWRYLDETPITNCCGNIGHYDLATKSWVAFPMSCNVTVKDGVATIVANNNPAIFEKTYFSLSSTDTGARALAEQCNRVTAKATLNKKIEQFHKKLNALQEERHNLETLISKLYEVNPYDYNGFSDELEWCNGFDIKTLNSIY